MIVSRGREYVLAQCKCTDGVIYMDMYVCLWRQLSLFSLQLLSVQEGEDLGQTHTHWYCNYCILNNCSTFVYISYFKSIWTLIAYQSVVFCISFCSGLWRQFSKNEHMGRQLQIPRVLLFTRLDKCASLILLNSFIKQVFNCCAHN